MINEDIILPLIIAEISGTLTEDERSSLEKMLAESAEARKLRDNMRAVLMTDKAKRALASIPEEAPVPTKTSNRKIYYVSVIAAAIAAIIIYVAIPGQQKVPFDKQLALQQEGIRLILDDGQSVSLDSSGFGDMVKGVHLQDDNNTLSWSVEDSYSGGAWSMIIIPAGRSYNLRLPDGTVVMLNSGSVISFPFSFTGSKREVKIEGEAYFTIAQDASKPFYVNTPKGQIRVLGTEFNINTYDDREKVSLVNGSVRYVTEKDGVTLLPGKSATRGENAMLIIADNNKSELRWKDGLMNYDDATLGELKRDVERFRKVRMVVEADGSTKTVSGFVDRNEPIAQFVERLSESDGIEYCKLANDTIYVK
jgi:transmembrane sensor